MKLIYKGKYSGDEATLPTREHPDGYVMFKEPDSKKFMLVANGISLAITVLFLLIAVIVGSDYLFSDLEEGKMMLILLSMILPMVCAIPHELIHALCMKETVYLYNYLKQGAMFVISLEDMSKTRFVLMSLAPNIVFGFIPFIVAMILPELYWLGIFGALNLGAGAGDYLNVYNALTQVPKGAKIYSSGFHSYWYQPDVSEEK